ncbi:MAG: hypothetical protein Tsb002_31710 [Wenzhouxiangellaceae bacterium]
MPVTTELHIWNNALLRSCGPDTAPLLFCVPGFACSGADYLPLFATSLSQRYRCMAVDLPGFAASPALAQPVTIDALADWLRACIEAQAQAQPVIVLAHSLGSVIAVEALHGLALDVALISIEGNLLDIDGYSSGRAIGFDDAAAFKQSFIERLWRQAQDHALQRRLYASALQSDANTLWRLGCEAVTVGEDDAFGQRMLALSCPKLYCWSSATTPGPTAAWVQSSDLPAHQYRAATHWPMLEAVPELKDIIDHFSSQR